MPTSTPNKPPLNTQPRWPQSTLHQEHQCRATLPWSNSSRYTEPAYGHLHAWLLPVHAKPKWWPQWNRAHHAECWPCPWEMCFTVRFTFALLTLARVSLSVSPFFSPLSLRRSVVVVCFEVTMSELLCLSACAMWSRGSWLGGSLVSAWCFCASLAFWYGLVIFWVLPFVFAAIPCRDDTMLSSLAWINPWTGTCHTLVLRFCFVLVFFACFVLVGLLLVGVWFLFGGDFITAFWPVTVHFWWPLNQRTAMCMR